LHLGNEARDPDSPLPFLRLLSILRTPSLTWEHAVTEDQREALLDLLLAHGHDKIGPEIRRELLAGRGRGVPLEPTGPVFDGDDTMQIDS
jgi:essential nuclear protein 1